MNRIIAFSARNIKELMRDPLSYIFCLGFPVIMLIVMTLVNSSIPPEAGMTIFRIDRLSGGIAIFGQTFVMLFAALTVSKDRSGSFLVRMYATPMKSSDFALGYMLPMLIIAEAQLLINYAASYIISLIVGVELNLAGMALSFIALIPSEILFISLGVLFGTLFNDKAAPGLCSIIISLGSFLGGIWFDAENTGGVLLTICRATPFLYCTKTARSAAALDLSAEAFLLPLLIVTVCAAVLAVLAMWVFGTRMKADLA